MKSLPLLCLVLGSLCHGILPNPASGQNNVVACELKIQTPQPGDMVGKEGKVRGTARVPTGSFVWVLTHMKDLVDKWWPQNDGPLAINASNGAWVTMTAYGVEKDIGEQFEIAVVAVNPGTNAVLMDWFKDAKQSHEYLPIPLPGTIDGCPPLIVTVTKAAHEHAR